MGVRLTTVVNTPPGDLSLVTLAIIKEELGIPGATTTYDVQLNRYIAQASAAIAQYCNRVFPSQVQTDTFDIAKARLQFFGEKSLQASDWPIITISAFTEAGVALVNGTDYRVDLSTGLLYRLGSARLDISWTATPIVVSYTGGYASIPSDVQDAATRMVRARWFAKDRDPLAKQESIPGVRDVSWWVPTGSDAGNIPPDVADLLSSYRVPVVA